MVPSSPPFCIIRLFVALLVFACIVGCAPVPGKNQSKHCKGAITSTEAPEVESRETTPSSSPHHTHLPASHLNKGEFKLHHKAGSSVSNHQSAQESTAAVVEEEDMWHENVLLQTAPNSPRTKPRASFSKSQEQDGHRINEKSDPEKEIKEQRRRQREVWKGAWSGFADYSSQEDSGHHRRN
jgi:hypothetical protein